MFGLLAYPAQGVYKSLASGRSVTKAMQKGRSMQLEKKEMPRGISREQVLARFESLRN